MRLLFGKTRKNPGWLAVSIHRDGVRVTHVERKPSALSIVNLAIFHALSKPADAQAMEKIGKELRAERYRCTTLLNPGDYQLLSVDAPNVQPDELKTAIRWRLKDMLDYHIDDATVDVLDVPVEKNGAARNHSMFAVAARNQLIEQRQLLFAESKFPLSVIDIPEMAQRNIAALMEPEGRGLAMLSFDQDGGLLTVTFSGELYLSRRIDVPLSQLTQDNLEQRNACYERITLELQRSLDHFDRQYHFITLAKLIIAPMDGASGLQESLAANLYVPVEQLNLETILDFSSVPEMKTLESQQRYFMTLGAALREEERAL